MRIESENRDPLPHTHTQFDQQEVQAPDFPRVIFSSRTEIQACCFRLSPPFTLPFLHPFRKRTNEGRKLRSCGLVLWESDRVESIQRGVLLQQVLLCLQPRTPVVLLLSSYPGLLLGRNPTFCLFCSLLLVIYFLSKLSDTLPCASCQLCALASLDRTWVWKQTLSGIQGDTRMPRNTVCFHAINSLRKTKGPGLGGWIDNKQKSEVRRAEGSVLRILYVLRGVCVQNEPAGDLPNLQGCAEQKDMQAGGKTSELKQL